MPETVAPVEKKESKQASTPMSHGGLNRPLKMVKMIQARCNVCNHRGQGRGGWWETCTHDPYNHIEAVPGAEEYAEAPDGTITKLDKPKVTYRKMPNWKQIADEPKISSGRLVQIQIERGSKFPAELGYDPICDYFNCWEPNPTIHAQRVVSVEGTQTVVGNYHSRDEAAIITLRLQQTPTYIGVDADVERRRAQLDAVNVL